MFAQTSKAGVVTVLEGNVTARRGAPPAAVPLKFKDDVFLQDTVATADKSLARMLLGGKALVTVRERSVLTITEVPGRSTIELESGKFALALAREKMRPGEEIQIRTPNAVAGVRGTVVVTEVRRQGAQVGAGLPAVLTSFFVLRGALVAQPLDAAEQPVGAPLQVGTLQSYTGAGLATPRVQPIPPEQIGAVIAGLQPTGPKR
ncbi:MAG TPA: FecR domain-containing protein, partial [Methylomirabilota bacterium]|nr:FecR domain-containing protein [Methylomirabilota bacterium]